MKRFMEWANECYVGFACMIVGIPLAGLILMEIACWIYLQDINAKIVALESMF